MTLSAGIPIHDALTLSAKASGNPALVKTATLLCRKLNTGLSLHLAMENTFPPLMTQLVKVGEESGKLEQMLDKIADFYESDANHLLANLSQLLEPLIMVLLGALIGGLVISMYLPIFNLGNTL